MKVIIAGSRNFNDYNLLKSSCDNLLTQFTNIEIVSGTARGADKLGESLTFNLKINLESN
jgi:predicted Rossmann fold nucleotide-binding protein DprA/Smf involved in DNA uptake